MSDTRSAAQITAQPLPPLDERCKHSYGFVKVSEYGSMGVPIRVVMVCIDGCGQIRNVFEDGTVTIK